MRGQRKQKQKELALKKIADILKPYDASQTLNL
jgi:hypothetical protein